MSQIVNGGVFVCYSAAVGAGHARPGGVPSAGVLWGCGGPHMGGPYRAANRKWSASSTPRGGGKTPPYGEPENGRL